MDINRALVTVYEVDGETDVDLGDLQAHETSSIEVGVENNRACFTGRINVEFDDMQGEGYTDLTELSWTKSDVDEIVSIFGIDMDSDREVLAEDLHDLDQEILVNELCRRDKPMAAIAQILNRVIEIRVDREMAKRS